MNAPAKKLTFVEIAARHWHPVPGWLQALAEEADRTSVTKAASRIGYSVGVVSSILRNEYGGSVETVAAKAKGALLGETVRCPVHGDIERDFCLEEQGKNFKDTSALRARVWRACRNGCPHSRIGLKKTGVENV